MIREAKNSKSNLTVVWLDLANACGSVPHKLIEEALDHYQIPDHIKKIINSYFGGIQLRFTAENYTTSWQRLEKGIVTGCTISPILCVVGTNLIMKVTDRETRGSQMKSGIYQSANRGYMDDLTVTTSTHKVVSWSRMKFKPRK